MGRVEILQKKVFPFVFLISVLPVLLGAARVGDRLEFKAEWMRDPSATDSKDLRVEVVKSVSGQPNFPQPQASSVPLLPNGMPSNEENPNPEESDFKKNWIIDSLAFQAPSSQKPGQEANPPRQRPTQADPSKQLLLSLTPLRPGNLRLPELSIRSSDGTEVAKIPSTSVEVESAIRADDPKASQMEPVEPPVGLPFPFWMSLGLLVLALLLLAGVFYGIYRLWRRWMDARKARLGNQPLRPEDEIALDELKELSKTDWIQKGNFKPYYFRLSEILKAYIGRRFGFDALESTTNELMTALAAVGLGAEPEKKGRIEEIFNKLDRVKFSDFLPTSSELTAQEPQELIENAKQWILVTRRIPLPPSESGVSTLKNEAVKA